MILTVSVLKIEGRSLTLDLEVFDYVRLSSVMFDFEVLDYRRFDCV